ncbi:Serine/threonine protein kinase [Handroanthus impetiginosus]|uniref:Serine/threonine protein kinase n=1 Tax=Handroanthus impetiginosus TaxID=429701 RepID=A0A2G9G8L3_9LAMI|nr:Serine/threonine protein kinase [Handroanthus impetiginosus]
MNLLLAGITAGAIFFVLVAISSYYILIPMKREYNDYKRITNILKNHEGMRPRRYSYAEVKEITNNFDKKLGTTHKGKLIDQTLVAVKMRNGSKENAEYFINEVDRISSLQHVNMLQMIGFSVDGKKRALIYESPPNGILEKFISVEDHCRKLGWEKLHQIAIGIAKGINYIHKETTKRNVRLDISPQSIFLDDNFDPKILILPDYIPHFETMSQKEDVYNFGVLLMDIVGRQRRFSENRGFHYPIWIYNQTGFGDERAIKIDEEEEEENEMVKKLCIVGLWCMQWFPCDRPSMKEVIQMLEGDKMPFVPPNPFDKLK